MHESLLGRLGLIATLVALSPRADAKIVDGALVAKILRSKRGFAHRTKHLGPILHEGWLLSGYEAAQKGSLKSHEPLFRRRKRLPFVIGERPHLHTEIFGTTQGILPPTTAYGRYGIVWLSDSLQHSQYVNFVPHEVVVEQPTSLQSAIVIVPAVEIANWNSRFPKRRFVAEEQIPKELILPSRDVSGLFTRIGRQLMRLLQLKPMAVFGKMRAL